MRISYEGAARLPILPLLYLPPPAPDNASYLLPKLAQAQAHGMRSRKSRNQATPRPSSHRLSAPSALRARRTEPVGLASWPAPLGTRWEKSHNSATSSLPRRIDCGASCRYCCSQESSSAILVALMSSTHHNTALQSQNNRIIWQVSQSVQYLRHHGLLYIY